MQNKIDVTMFHRTKKKKEKKILKKPQCYGLRDYRSNASHF